MKKLKTILIIAYFVFWAMPDKYALANEVTDSKNCHSVELTGTNVSCHGLDDGSANLSITGGSGNFAITWSTGAENVYSITDLPAGIYHVNVFDIDNQCVAIDIIHISQPDNLQTYMNVSNVKCNGDASGEIILGVSGGTPPYSFEWSNMITSQNNYDLEAGSYDVTVIDSDNCETYDSAEVEEPELLEVSVSSIDNLCFGQNMGQIEVLPSGGNPPYSYTWANPEFILNQSTGLIENLQNNYYFVTVTDNSNCTVYEELEITSPEEIVVGLTGTNVSSLGGSDGQIDLTVEGGVSPYLFNWSNGAETQNNYDLPAGTYYLTVTDANLCNAYASIVISEPSEELLFNYTVNNVTCNGGNDGEIHAFPEGGIPPYSFLWSTGSTLSNIDELQAGTYILTLTDANLVEYVDTVIITQPDPFVFTYLHSNPSCYGFSDGNIFLTAGGGVPPYIFLWYDADSVAVGSEADLTNIPSGLYTVELIDDMGCTGNFSVTLSQPATLELSVTKSHIQCYGDTTGSIISSASGGSAPYYYYWSDKTNDADLINLAAGEYGLTVTDSNGCAIALEAVLTQAEVLTVDLFAYDISCAEQADGYIISEVSGGSGGYQYLWSNDETNPDIYDLEKGEYSITVSDIFDCSTEITAEVGGKEIACLNIPNSFTPNGTGINDEWVIRNIHLYPNCLMQVFNSWGQIVFESQGYTEKWDGTYNGNALPSGTYYYILSFSNGLETITGTVTIIK